MATTLVPGNFLSSTTATIEPNASGWRPRLNAVLGLGTNGSNGFNCLFTRSVAAGEMQAETVSAYAVTPGTLYFAFADAAAATQPERIGILWLDATYAAVGTITWSLTASAASSSFHRVSVAGAAPAGAAWVRLVLSATTAAAAVPHYWDNLYLGLPLRTQGNNFGFPTESSEVDASAWGGAVNGAIGRQMPPAGWAQDWYYSGGQVMTLTASANGNISMVTTERPPVAPGTEYLGRAYLNPPSTANTAWVELRYYNAAGTQIQATRGTLAPPGTSWYRQRVSAVAPPTAATCALAVGLDSATTGQVLRADGAVIELAPVFAAGSILPYADGSFEQGLAGWSRTAGSATVARSTPWGATSYDGSYSMLVTSTATGATTVTSARFVLTAGEPTWRMRALMSALTGGWTLVLRFRSWNGAGAELAPDASVSIPLTTDATWRTIDSDWVPPAGAVEAAIEYTVTATVASSSMAIDRIALWPALPLVSVVAASDRGAVVLTARELPVGQLIWVWRYGADGIRTLVRGPEGLLDGVAITSDLLLIEDYEAPLGVPVRYRIDHRPASSTAVTWSVSDEVTLDAGDRNVVWLSDPGMPQRNMKVMVERAPDWTRPIPQATYVVRGRRNAVTLSGVRGGLQGDLQVWTRSDEERTRLHWLLDSGDTLLWRAAPGMGVDDMYVNVAEVTEARVSGWAPELWRAWTLPLTEADMPTSVGVGGTSGRTWRDVLAEFATWGDVLAAYATWEDVLFDRKIAGG